MTSRLILSFMVCIVGLWGCSAGGTVGFTVPIGPNVGIGVSVGTDGGIGLGVGVSAGGGQIGASTSGQLPVKKDDETTQQK